MEIKQAGTALLFTAIVSGMAFGFVSGMTAVTEYKTVDSEADWNKDESSSTNINVSDKIRLKSSSTTGSYSTVGYDISANNLTSVDVSANLENTSSSNASATFQYRDDTGTIQTSETVELGEGTTSVDVDNSYAQVNIEYDLDRDSASVKSPQVDYYKVNQETDSTLGLTVLRYAIPLFALGAVAAITS